MRRSFASSATTFPKLVSLSLSGYSNQGVILFSSVAVRLAKKSQLQKNLLKVIDMAIRHIMLSADA